MLALFGSERGTRWMLEDDSGEAWVTMARGSTGACLVVAVQMVSSLSKVVSVEYSYFSSWHWCSGFRHRLVMIVEDGVG